MRPPILSYHKTPLSPTSRPPCPAPPTLYLMLSVIQLQSPTRSQKGTLREETRKLLLLFKTISHRVLRQGRVQGLATQPSKQNDESLADGSSADSEWRPQHNGEFQFPCAHLDGWKNGRWHTACHVNTTILFLGSIRGSGSGFPRQFLPLSFLLQLPLKTLQVREQHTMGQCCCAWTAGIHNKLSHPLLSCFQ